MRISFSPRYYLNPLSLELEKTSGDRLRINDELIDLNVLNDGDIISAEHAANLSDWFAGPIEKVGDEVRLTVTLPYTGRTHVEPIEPITVAEDGPIAVPVIQADEVEPAE